MRSPLIAVAAMIAASPALAADIPAQSKIDAVTVYPAGAEVTRSAKVKLSPGDHTVILTDLPANANPSSIRVEGKATGKLEIGSVDSRVLSIPRTDAGVIASERKKIETEIETLKDAKSVLNNQVQTAEAQKALISNLTTLPSRPAPTTGTAAGENWAQMLALIGTSMSDVHKVILETQIKMREIDRKIADLAKKLTETAPTQDARLEVKVFANAGVALDADLVIRYQVANAGWQPMYDARLTTGNKTVAPKLSLTRRATISQRTGEAWENIALTLSTARPSAGTVAAELQPLTVDLMPERPVAGASPTFRSVKTGLNSVQDGLERRADSPPPAPAPAAMAIAAPAQETVAQIQASPFQALYAIPGQLSVPATGEPKRVVIDNAELEPALVVRATPKLEAKAYLYAKLLMPKTTPYLPGQVALFRDNTFVGNGRLPMLTPGEDHELGFGADDAVRIKYANTDEKRSESGIISSSKNDARNYRITMTNKHERPIAITITDQMPVSNNAEIKVEMVAKPQPTKKDVEDKRGIVAWEDTLKVDEEKTIDFGYKVTWPAAKQIQYGR